jgi:hypothetical protein
MARDSLHEQIVATLLTDAWRAVLADPNVPFGSRLDALAQRLPAVEEGAKALRMIADDWMISTAGEATRAGAAQAVTARKAAAARAQAETDKITRLVQRDAAQAALRSAQHDLAEAEREASIAEKSEAPARERLLLKGAVREAAERVEAAEGALAKVSA